MPLDGLGVGDAVADGVEGPTLMLVAGELVATGELVASGELPANGGVVAACEEEAFPAVVLPLFADVPRRAGQPPTMRFG